MENEPDFYGDNLSCYSKNVDYGDWVKYSDHKQIVESQQKQIDKYKEIESTIDDIYGYDDLNYVAMLLREQLKELRELK